MAVVKVATVCPLDILRRWVIGAPFLAATPTTFWGVLPIIAFVLVAASTAAATPFVSFGASSTIKSAITFADHPPEVSPLRCTSAGIDGLSPRVPEMVH
jgi:hypothetical protein